MSYLCHAVKKNNKLGALYTNAILFTVNHIHSYTDPVVSDVETVSWSQQVEMCYCDIELP